MIAFPARLLFAAFLASLAPHALRGQETDEVPADLAFVSSGGYWEAGAERGQYRLLVFSNGFEHIISTVFVQWIRDPHSAEAPGETAAVVATVPVSEVNDQLTWSLGAPSVTSSPAGTTATLEMANSHLPDQAPRVCTLRLGQPGRYTASCKPR